MSWSLFRWVWRLKAPLAIGLPPAGSLNRCRLYAPARTVWGGLTAKIAQQRATGFPEYAKVGEALARDLRLTYLYPAQETGGDWRAWLPCYQRGGGLSWRREDEADPTRPLPDRELRRRLLIARPGTAIDPASDAAAEGTLRETECVSQHWRAESSVGGPVGLVGYAFVRDSAGPADELARIDLLSLGGDTRYGLGLVRRIAWERCADADVFGALADLSGPEPWVRASRVLGHAQAADDVVLTGQLEALGGWDRATDGRLEALSGAPLWAPGSTAADGAVRWRVSERGVWQANEA